MPKFFVFPINNNTILGFTETKEEIPLEADNPVKEVEIHPAQLEWIADGFNTFGDVQRYLADLLYRDEEEQQQLELEI